jgi:hypothetical protein
MASSRFDWSALPSGLLRQLKKDLGLHGGDVPQALARTFGDRPTEEFVQRVWPTLRDCWIAKDPVVRRSVVVALRARRLGSKTISGAYARAEVAYLRSCRNGPGLREVVLAHLLALGEHVSLVRGKPSPHAARSDAWGEFARKLAMNLAQLEADQCLILSTRRRPGRYVQFAQRGSLGLRVETVSNAHLEEWDRLDDEALLRLKDFGWLSPTDAPDEKPEREGTRNYYREWSVPVPYGEAAKFAVRTLDEVLEVHHPGFLVYRAFAHGDTAVILPNLGLARESDEHGSVPAHAGSEATSAAGPDELLGQVKEVVRALLSVDEVATDDDGDIPIRSMASITYVRVFRDAPVVRVFSPVLWDMGDPTDVEETVNEINKTTNWVKAIWDKGAVVLFSDVVGSPLAEAQLAAAIQSVVDRADEYGPQLQEKYGGRTAFGVALPPRQAPIGGYL